MVAKDLTDDVRIKAMMLYYAREAISELCYVAGVVTDDSFAQANEKLTAYFMPRRNEYEVTFRQAKQIVGETLDQCHARLQQLAKKCNFQNKNREIKSQIVQKCLPLKIRDKGISEANITLEQLLTYGHTLEANVPQYKNMGNTASVAEQYVDAVFHDETVIAHLHKGRTRQK